MASLFGNNFDMFKKSDGSIFVTFSLSEINSAIPSEVSLDLNKYLISETHVITPKIALLLIYYWRMISVEFDSMYFLENDFSINTTDNITYLEQIMTLIFRSRETISPLDPDNIE